MEEGDIFGDSDKNDPYFRAQPDSFPESSDDDDDDDNELHIPSATTDSS
jgi:hypothetical protein